MILSNTQNNIALPIDLKNAGITPTCGYNFSAVCNTKYIFMLDKTEESADTLFHT